MTRKPFDLTDAHAGMAWWNAMSQMNRSLWLHRAGSDCPADAWELFKAVSQRGTQSLHQAQQHTGEH